MQHIGATRIGALGFTEISVQASECAFVYDKVRRAELRRNVWRFATRLCVLRPFSATTMQLNPVLWSSLTTYFIGSLVSDAQGALWQSQIADNLNNQPGNSNAWELYFGPLVCDRFDPTQSYYSGDVVYVAPGDGTYLVYVSTMQSNGLSPTNPAVWLATNTYFKDDVVVVFPAWAVGTTYAVGATVIDSAGNLWTSIVTGNVGHTPSSSPAQWVAYPPPAVFPGGENAYYSGYSNAPTGGGAPLTFGTQPTATGIAEWSPLTTYTLGQLVDYDGIQYVAFGAVANLNLVPPSNTGSWAPISRGTYYQSLVDLNQNQPPATSAGAWTTVLTQSSSNGPGWELLPAMSLTSPMLVYPLGSGPSQQSATRNVFALPSNFLREAPQDPKAGSTSYLGSPSGLMYTDWEYQGNYLISRTAYPIVYRFVADVTLVPTFDDMFCEGLGALIGESTCERITQSDAKVQVCQRIYMQKITEARAVNGIETGSTEPAEDDFITCRI